MLFKSVRLYFARKKLLKLYSKVQETAAQKLILRKKIQLTQEEFLDQVEYMRTKFNIDNPKLIVLDQTQPVKSLKSTL